MFDTNNLFEFSSKVQTQIEQIELGLEEKVRQSLENISTLISGLIISFINNGKSF